MRNVILMFSDTIVLSYQFLLILLHSSNDNNQLYSNKVSTDVEVS